MGEWTYRSTFEDRDVRKILGSKRETKQTAEENCALTSFIIKDIGLG
jgi:hypothetical protein